MRLSLALGLFSAVGTAYLLCCTAEPDLIAQKGASNARGYAAEENPGGSIIGDGVSAEEKDALDGLSSFLAGGKSSLKNGLRQALGLNAADLAGAGDPIDGKEFAVKERDFVTKVSKTTTGSFAKRSNAEDIQPQHRKTTELIEKVAGFIRDGANSVDRSSSFQEPKAVGSNDFHRRAQEQMKGRRGRTAERLGESAEYVEETQREVKRQLAPVTKVRLNPIGAMNGQEDNRIETFKWLIVENDVGSTEGSLEDPPPGCGPNDDGYPQDCDWPSIRAIKAHAPIYASGDSTEWGRSTPMDISRVGKYMVTVMAEGYRLCGGYFEVTEESQDDIAVTPVCQKFPLSLGTIRLMVFKDNMPLNGQYDAGEEPLADFGIGVNDIEGPVTVDYYGNDIRQIVSDENGMIVVPNMWPGRYDLDVAPPPTGTWVKTNTLEGGPGWDYWLYEGFDGYDNEFVVGAEQFPLATAGFTEVFNKYDKGNPDGYVMLSGTVETASVWPNGINYAEVGTVFDPINSREQGPLFNQDGLVAINDLGQLDQTMAVIRTNADGTWSINLPAPGNYMISWFDISKFYLLQFRTVTLNDAFDMGKMYLTGWYTNVQGHFFIDKDGDGMFDEGEEGLQDAGFPVFRVRDGTQVDRGLQFEVPFRDGGKDRVGFYKFQQAYPWSSWITLHSFHPLWELTGYSYKTEQMPDFEKVQANGDQYDIALFGTPGVHTTLNIGFRRKNQEKGSIYGSVVYDTTRTNLRAAEAVTENHEPGIPGIVVSLYHLDGNNDGCNRTCTRESIGYACADEGNSTTDKKLTCTKTWVGMHGESRPFPILAWAFTDTGQFALDFAEVKNVTTAQFKTPTNCRITDSNNAPIKFGEGQNVLPDAATDPTDPGVPCLETPMLRNQVGGFLEVDGSFKFEDLEPGLYALSIDIPMDLANKKPAYKVRSENDVNSYDSDQWQGTFCPGTKEESCPVCPSVEDESDSCPITTDATQPRIPNMQNVDMPCAGAWQDILHGDGLKSVNAAFAANGGSHHAPGSRAHGCDIKLLWVEAGVNKRASFHLFTDVPIPSRFKGVVLNDVTPEANPNAMFYTELQGVPHIPVGVRDFTRTKLTDAVTDPNGFFELLVPSTRNNGNAPSGSSIMPGMWCLTANDPGTRGFPSIVPPLPNYRAISACFEAIPGRIIPVDLAVVAIRAPTADGAGNLIDVPCKTPETKPQLFNVHGIPGDNGQVDNGPICTAFPCTLRLRGRNFGSAPVVELLVPDEQQQPDDGPFAHHGSPPTVTTTTTGVFHVSVTAEYTYDEMTIMINDGSFGMYTLRLTTASGESWHTGISVHLWGDTYKPKIYDTADYDATLTKGSIQAAIDAWEADTANHQHGGIVLIRPATLDEATNPEGAHLENLIMSRPVKLQGFGSGGENPAVLETQGTHISGAAFAAGIRCDNPPDLFCDALAKDAWLQRLYDAVAGREIGNNALVEGSVLYVLGNAEQYNDMSLATEALAGGIDGCRISGGFQANRVIQPLTVAPGPAEVRSVQGGGITLHSYTKYFRISNNAIISNSGSYGGGIRVGTPFLNQATGAGSSFNTNLTISGNQILYNGGFNLAGGIGIFGGSHSYVIDNNHICGNNGQEYGGGISHFGVSQYGRISNNWILWNRAVDEGGGILIATETLRAVDRAGYPEDAGSVRIENNIIQGCVSGDDGGGIRFLNPGLSEYNVTHNIITHNVAMHEGGGISINDAPFVDVTFNVIMHNMVTGTAAESPEGTLLASGMATNMLSPLLQERLAEQGGDGYSHSFSHPIRFENNIFWDNRASDGTKVANSGTNPAPSQLQGLGKMGSTAAETWIVDMASSDGEQLMPFSSQVSPEVFYDEYNSCISSTSYLSDFFPVPPFKCEGGNLSPSTKDSVVRPVPWGVDTMILQVQGLTGTKAGSNTYHIIKSMDILKGGPIGNYTRTPVNMRRVLPSLLRESGVALNWQRNPKENGIPANEPFKRFDQLLPKKDGQSPEERANDIDNTNTTSSIDDQKTLRASQRRGSKFLQTTTHCYWFSAVAVALALATLLLNQRRLNAKRTEGGDNVGYRGNAKKSILFHFCLSAVIVLGLSADTLAEPACTIDCQEIGNPITHPQTKYETPLFVPPIIDLRADKKGKCRDPDDFHVTIHMTQGDWDWGLKNDLGDPLLTQIWGYTCIHNAKTGETSRCTHPTTGKSVTKNDFLNKPTFPGPTILVSKDCPVKITFVNKLGTGSHLFPIDRTLHCGSATLDESYCKSGETVPGTKQPLQAAPVGKDWDFYCNCTSQRGSDRRTTVHLHGAHVQSSSDGHPQSWYTDTFNDGTVDHGERFTTKTPPVNEDGETIATGTNYYPNDQNACMLFFHDHALGITRLNVYAGLAGLYIIESKQKSDLFDQSGLKDILGNVKRDIPLAFSDRTFGMLDDSTGAELIFPYGVSDGGGGDVPPFSILPENFGYTLTVNGKIWPKLEVQPNGFYLLRLLNAADSRFYKICFQVGNWETQPPCQDPNALIPFTIVANDQGLLGNPAQELTELLLGPAERYEILISFSDYAGEKVTLRNSEPTLMGPVEAGLDDQLMQFHVQAGKKGAANLGNLMLWDDTIYDEWDIYSWSRLLDITRPEVVNENILNDLVNKRELWITERTQILSSYTVPGGARPFPLLGSRATPFGVFYQDAITEQLLQNKPTVWEFVNLSADAHVIHLHQVKFKILDRQDVGLSYHTFQYPTGMYRQYAKNSQPAEPWEDGPKDTFISYPGTVTRIVTIFDIPGRYVWHCHILSHEDHMMIRELVVGNPGILPCDYINPAKHSKKGSKNDSGQANGYCQGQVPTEPPTKAPRGATKDTKRR